MLYLCCTQTASGQLLRVSPPFPTADDTVTVVYDATQGTGGLRDFVPVYAHTGVITNLSRTSSDWRYVVAQWGTDNPKVRMTPLGNNLHSLRFHIRSFYAVPQSEEIRQLAFVFRSASGDREGKAAGGADIFYPVYAADAFVARILAPTIAGTAFYQAGDTIRIQAAASAASTLVLSDGSVQLAQVSNGREISVNYIVPPSAAGTIRTIRFSATRTLAGTPSETRTDSLSFFVRSTTPIAPLPSGAATGGVTLQDGINYINDSTVVLVLFAPNKDFAYVVGDFNNWQPTGSGLMSRTPDGQRFWIRLTGLVPRREYGFQYLIDGNVRTTDPYVEKVLDPFNDPEIIRENRYPNLLPYPTGKTTGMVGVLQTAQQPYNWRVQSFQRPRPEDLVIYELLVRDFSNRRTFRNVIDSLQYLKRLGVNCIELMPVMEFDGNLSWGYNPAFFCAVDKYYGTENDLRELIDSAHALGMAVVLDMVLNHATGSCPLFQLYPLAENPYFNAVATHPFNVFNDFNHEFIGTQIFVDRVNRFWLERFKFDGFRFDLSKGFTQVRSGSNVSLWSARDTSRIRLLKRMADVIWRFDPTAYVILEHFADNSEERELADYGMMLWGNANYNYNEATMGWHSNPQQSDFGHILAQRRGWTRPLLVGYMESHDEERLMFKNIQFANQSAFNVAAMTGYNPRDTTTALERMKMATTFFYTIPGPKLLWQFGELGYDYSINYPTGREDSRLALKPVRWDYYADPRRRSLYDLTAALTRLKTTQEVFRTTNVTQSLAGALKRLHLSSSTNSVTIIGNFGVEPAAIAPHFQRAGVWHEFFTRRMLTVRDTAAPIMLRPGEFALYSTTPFPAPPANLVTSVQTSSLQTTLTITQPPQMSSYAIPNPTSSSAEIVYTLSEAATVTVSVVNTLGEEVAILLHQQPQVAGEHRVWWSSAISNNAYHTLPTGMYFYRIVAYSARDTVGPTVQRGSLMLVR
jgi:1,4-alpha-glucan branching enzyme